MSVNQIQISKELDLQDGGSEAQTTITQAVARAQATAIVDTSPLTEQQELQTLRQIITTWREVETDVSTLNAEIREKKKRQKALEEMVLRIMKKHNIGALDLKGSGGRLLYHRKTTKAALNPKVLTGLLATHLKSETAAAEAIKYIGEHRESRVHEKLVYEKN
jgi:hypothetical protein